MFSFIDLKFFPLSILLVLNFGKAAFPSQPGKSLSIHLQYYILFLTSDFCKFRVLLAMPLRLRQSRWVFRDFRDYIEIGFTQLPQLRVPAP